MGETDCRAMEGERRGVCVCVCVCVCDRETGREREIVGVAIVWRRECGDLEEDKRKTGPELAASHTALASTTSIVSLRFFYR
jgi:hypothetical protein